MAKIAQYAKFIVAILSAAAVAAVQYGVTLPAPVQQWLPVAVAVLGAITVYAVPNRKPTPAVEDPEPTDAAIDAQAQN